jgi:alkylhydroperoxidase family enzyme
MTPQTEVIVCSNDETKNITCSPEELAAFISGDAPTGRKRKPARDRTEADVYLDPRLEDLVRLRVVQIHGCKWGVQEQKTKLKVQGETYQRLHQLENWRTEGIFSDRERAALNLAEAITHDPISAIPDVVFHAACAIFSESEVICLILVILAVNDWHYLDRKQSLCLEPVSAGGFPKSSDLSESSSKATQGVAQSNDLIKQ